MNVMGTGESLWKVLFGFMLVVVVLIFFGAFALSGSELFNPKAADAAYIAQNSQTALSAQQGQIDLAVYAEKANGEIRAIQAQTDVDVKMIDEGFRVTRANNDRNLETLNLIARAKVLLGLIAACAALLVAVYGLLLAVHHSVERWVPARPVVAPAAPVPRSASRPYDPWCDPAYRQMRRRQARQREQEARRRKAERRRAREVTLDPLWSNGPLRSNGHGPLRRPIRQLPE